MVKWFHCSIVELLNCHESSKTPNPTKKLINSKTDFCETSQRSFAQLAKASACTYSKTSSWRSFATSALSYLILFILVFPRSPFNSLLCCNPNFSLTFLLFFRHLCFCSSNYRAMQSLMVFHLV